MNSESTSRTEPQDRVRANTHPRIDEAIDRDLEQRIRFYAAQDAEAINERLAELDREWDIERVLQANAASVGLTGLILGIFSNRRWLVLPVVVSGFLLQHAVQGWCPPLPVFRRLKVRTRREIERERYALKVLRGDFDFDGESGRDAVEISERVQAV